MNTDRRLQTALFNVSKFNSFELAKSCSNRQVYHTRILLGDDDRYWVPSTHRETGLLIAAGYEAAE